MRLGHDVDGLGIEVSHLGDLAVGTLHVLLAEQCSGLGPQFAPDDIIIEAVIAVDYHLVDRRLLSLVDTHLKVDRVALDVDLHRVKRVKQITVVVVKVAHGILVGVETLVEFLLIVDIPFLHVEDIVQPICRVECVAHPRDVAQVVLLSLLDLHLDVHRLAVVRCHAVPHYTCVTVAQLVVLVDDELFVLFVLLFDELFGLEEREQIALLTRFLHRAAQFLAAEHAVALECDAVDLNLFLFVNVDIYDYLSFRRHVIALGDVHLGVLEALVVKVPFYQLLGTVDVVWGDLVAFGKLDDVLHVFLFAFLQAVVTDIRDAGTRGKGYLEPYLAALDFRRLYLHVREEAVPPVAFCRLGDFFARHRDDLPHGKARDAEQQVVLGVFYAFKLYACYLIFLGIGRVDDDRQLFSLFLGRSVYQWRIFVLPRCRRGGAVLS